MSTPPSHTDFVLPGTSVRGSDRWTLALAYAYSQFYNSRRVESLFYGIWDTVLNDLVFDMTPKVFVVPQLLLDTGFTKSNPNPNASIATVAQKGAKDITPDFGLAEIQYTIPPGLSLTNILDFPRVIITAAKTPALVEVKRPPTRRPESVLEFRSEVESLLLAAQADLDIQAENAFQEQRNTTSIVLIACSGVWWTWRSVTRQALEPEPTDFADFFLEIEAAATEQAENPDRSSEEDDSDGEYIPSGKGKLPVTPREIRGRGTGERQIYTMEKEPPVTREDLVPYKPGVKGEGKTRQKRPVQYFTDLGEDYMAPVMENVEDARPTGKLWAKILHLGSQASNQNMYLIYNEIAQGRMP